MKRPDDEHNLARATGLRLDALTLRVDWSHLSPSTRRCRVVELRHSYGTDQVDAAVGDLYEGGWV